MQRKVEHSVAGARRIRSRGSAPPARKLPARHHLRSGGRRGWGQWVEVGKASDGDPSPAETLLLCLSARRVCVCVFLSMKMPMPDEQANSPSPSDYPISMIMCTPYTHTHIFSTLHPREITRASVLDRCCPTPADRHRPACRPRLFPLPILGNCTAPLGERRDGLAPGLPGDSASLVSPPAQSHAQTYPESSGIPPPARFSGVNRAWCRSAAEIASPSPQRKNLRERAGCVCAP